MSKRPNFDEFMKIALQDPAFKHEYELLEPEFQIIQKFIKARKKAHYSQIELAKKLDLQQPAIARLERGGYATTSVAKLARVADALGYSINISLKPKKSAPIKKKLKRS